MQWIDHCVQQLATLVRGAMLDYVIIHIVSFDSNRSWDSVCSVVSVLVSLI